LLELPAGLLGGDPGRVGLRLAGRGIREAGDGLREAGRGLREAGRGIREAGDGLRLAGRGLRLAGGGLRDAGRGILLADRRGCDPAAGPFELDLCGGLDRWVAGCFDGFPCAFVAGFGFREAGPGAAARGGTGFFEPLACAFPCGGRRLHSGTLCACCCFPLRIGIREGEGEREREPGGGVRQPACGFIASLSF